MTGDIVEKDRMTAGNKTDIEVAGMVRMLMRDDLNHEFVCLAGRDRIMYLSQQLETLTKERDRLNKRDCNATIELCYESKNHPFEREQLKILDVGVSDNVYVVESGLFKALQEDNERLRTAMENKVSQHVDCCCVICEAIKQN